MGLFDKFKKKEDVQQIKTDEQRELENIVQQNGLPKNLLVIEDCDEFYHCLDTSNGKIASWSQYDNDGVIYCFDNFYDFFKDNLENAIENF